MTGLSSHRAGRAVVLAASALTMVASAAAQVAVRGFEGTSQFQNFLLDGAFRPPDTMGAVGTTQFLETTNGSVTVYDKLSGAVQLRIGANAFWQNAGQTGTSGDQRTLFDHYTNRWIVIGFGSLTADINIAVSDTSNALGSWKSTQFTGFAGGTADYPTLGLDDKGVYIATNNFSTTFQGTRVNVIPKADLFGGAPSAANITSFTYPYPAVRDRGYAIQGAVNWGGNPTNTASFMAASTEVSDQQFWRVSGVNGPGATQTASIAVGGVGYANPQPGRQPDGSRLVDTLDDRISANIYQVGNRLYSVHTVTPNATDFTAVRWTVVDATTGTLIDEGDISGGNFDYYQGSIAVNEFGQAVIGYNRSGLQTTDLNGDGKEDGRISFLARAFQADASGGLDAAGAEQLLRVSDVNDYHAGARAGCDPSAGNCRERWGDYSAVTIDPGNHRSFYAIGEYAGDWVTYITSPRAQWATYIAEITLVPEPSQYALLMIGLGVVGWAARRRKTG